MKQIKDLSVKSYYIDRTGKLSVSFMFYQMQEIAWENANTLGLGFEHLRKDQLFWVLSRLLVRIKRMPAWKEKFTLETWPRGSDGFYAYRDFRFRDETGADIIAATSSWLALDLQTKRIKKLSDFKEFPYIDENIIGQNAGKVESPESGEPLVYTPVLFNEIDINQHFNSGRYIERIIDSYSFEMHEKYELSEFEINFMKEGMPGDRLAIKKQKTDEFNHLCSVVRENGETELVKARLLWEKH